MLRLLRIVLLTACLTASTADAKTLDARTFADEMIRLLKSRAPGSAMTRKSDPLEIAIAGGTWDGATISLHRIYGYCRNATPIDCETTRREFAAKVLTKPSVASGATLRIAVRDREYVEHARAAVAGGPKLAQKIFARSLGDDLFALLVADSADTLALVNAGELARIGLTEEQAWTRAWLQTRLKLPALPTAGKLKDNAVAYQDQEYLASMLSDLDGWTPIAAAVGPDLFVTVVADNFVFVGNLPAGPGLEKFRRTVREDCAAQPRCVSPNVYRFRDGHWVVAR